MKHKFYTHHFLSSKIKSQQVRYNNNKYCRKLNLSHQIRISNEEKKSDAHFNIISQIWRHISLMTADAILFFDVSFFYTDLKKVWQLNSLSVVIFILVLSSRAINLFITWLEKRIFQNNELKPFLWLQNMMKFLVYGQKVFKD